MIAVCRIRPAPHYRLDAFLLGLKRAGYTVAAQGNPRSREDFLVLWNRHHAEERIASGWEKDGGTVIVVENGYIGSDSRGRQFYAISIRGHNGSGWFPVSHDDRFAALRVPLSPWRTTGKYILVCGQRSIGSMTMASPPDWHKLIARRAAKLTAWPVRVRPHPGNNAPTVPLDSDLAGAMACLIWSSSCGVRALTLGVPVFYCAPHWICEGAARRGITELHRPLRDDTKRLAALHAMSWGQWSVAEIESGQPFINLRTALGAH